MKIDYVIKSNRNLKHSAQNIFGKNNVTEAYVCVNYHEHISKQEHRQLLNQIQVEKSEDHIGFDGETIIIVLNGKAIKFTSSEWASMQLANLKNTIEL